MAAAVKKPKKESGWAKAGVTAGVIGALAAAAVFVFPTKDGRLGQTGGNSTSSSGTAQNRTTAAPNPSLTSASYERHLAELPLTQGGGVVTVLGGRDLSMPCGSGQSDDSYRQIEYELPGSYTSFTTRATAGGKSDPEAKIGVEVFVRARQERSDRTPRAGCLPGVHPPGRRGPHLQHLDELGTVVGRDVEGDEVQPVLGRGDDPGLVPPGERDGVIGPGPGR